MDRLDYFDNLKALLIFLVVFGHYAVTIGTGIEYIYAIVAIIFIFHMPLFIFISGIFSRMQILDEHNTKYIKRFSITLINYLMIYLAVYCSLKIFDKGTAFNILTAQGGSSAWFMMTILWCTMITPFLIQIGPRIGLPLLFAVAIVSRFLYVGGDLLSISRSMAFMPFFAIGLYFGPRVKEIIKKVSPSKLARVISFVFIILISAVVMSRPAPQIVIIKWLAKGRSTFNEILDVVDLECSFSVQVTVLLVYLGLVFLMSVLVMLIVPNKRIPFITSVGGKTLQIYIGHSMLWYAARSSDRAISFCEAIPRSMCLPASFVISLVAVIIFSLPPNIEKCIVSAIGSKFRRQDIN